MRRNGTSWRRSRVSPTTVRASPVRSLKAFRMRTSGDGVVTVVCSRCRFTGGANMVERTRPASAEASSASEIVRPNRALLAGVNPKWPASSVMTFSEFFKARTAGFKAAGIR